MAGYVWLPLELSGQRRKRITEAESFIEWTQANAVAAQAAAAGEAVAHYGACMVAAARVESFTALQTIAEEQHAFFRKRHDQGDATRQEWKIAESELARVQALFQETQADLARATAALASLLGEPIGPPPTREAWGAGRAQPIAQWNTAATSAEGATTGFVDEATAAEAPALSKMLEHAPLLQALRQERAFFKASAARARRTAQDPVNFIVSAGRGDFGETRLGGGLAWALPTLRRGQDEAAVLLAEAGRADSVHDALLRALTLRLGGLLSERAEVEKALDTLETLGIPAIREALAAAMETQRAGKTEFIVVLTAQRSRSELELHRLTLLLRDWSILADIATLTGKAPTL